MTTPDPAATLVLQSHRPGPVPPWIAACLASVRGWAEDRGHAYRLLDDALFDGIPGWFMDKCRAHGRTATAADLGRLLRAREALAEPGVERVVWLDADVLVYAPERLDLEPVAQAHPHAFALEVWVQPGRNGGRPVARRNVHNACCLFTPRTPVLDFLAHACERLVERLEPEKGFPPQLCGPRLLNALHPLVRFPLIETVGMVSPLLASDLLGEGGGRALRVYRDATADLPAPAAANLCSSLADPAAGRDDAWFGRLVEGLLTTGGAHLA